MFCSSDVRGSVSRRGALIASLVLPLAATWGAAANEPALLFYLSGDKGTLADFSAGGTPKPNVDSDVNVITDGARGPGLSCAHTQVLSYWAPGNIYAQRGTLSFFWRSREPVGPTEFPIFRVAYADHSSWDMVWLRIDYNGHGFDAFVTDANLSRTRVSYTIPSFPKPEDWTHLAVSWDETTGLRFYVNGKLAGEKRTVAVYDAALDQFGPHSRIISPHQVQSDYNFVRGGDLDELRIYDRALPDDAIAALAQRASAPTLAPTAAAVSRDLGDARWRNEWLLRYGWNRPDDIPAALPAAETTVRKVEIHDAYDLKRWWWKANDGIRETTWPGVYNRSRLPGRNDYFQLPDWDCYSVSGKSVTFFLPNEPWNHVEVAGSAWGQATLLPAKTSAGPSGSEDGTTLFQRPQGQEVTTHSLAKPVTGGRIRFDNVEQEQPIAEFSAYYVHEGAAPQGTHTLTYTLTPATADEESPTENVADGSVTAASPSSLAGLVRWIHGRFVAEERQLLVARPPSAAGSSARIQSGVTGGVLPIVHVAIPNATGDGYRLDSITDGLDGISLEIPGLAVKPTHGDRVLLNVQVKDPLWPLRDMMDFTFSAKPGQLIRLWLDLRDRILPPGKPLYLTVAASAPEFGRATLSGATVALVFKSREAARAEHEFDRFTQARDSYAMLVEERPHDARFNLWNRFEGDLRDLLRVNPDHALGRSYATAAQVSGFEKPAFKQPEAPAGVPLWAFRQVQVLEAAKQFALWYVDHRQIENGELGGGISDDTDLLNIWPGLVLMGAEPDKLKDSMRRLLQAAYDNGMFTRGISTIQADELHSYEEGINAISQNLISDFGNPLQLERAMETARGVSSITGVNTAGHRHIRSSYYSGSRLAEDSVWGYAKGYSYLVLQPGMLLVDYNGNPLFEKTVTELADGLLAHGKEVDGRYVLPRAIHFATDKDTLSGRFYFPWHVFWTSYLWTGDAKYLQPILHSSDYSALSVNADTLDLLKLRGSWKQRAITAEEPPPREPRTRGDVRGVRNRAPENRETSSLHFAWQVSGDKTNLEKLYAAQIEQIALLNYINTEGSLWIDRVSVPTAEIQRARLGGIALVRNSLFPGNTVSWRFQAPATEQSLGILLPYATPTEFKVIAYNLETRPVTADLIGAQVDPGVWEVSQGVDTTGKDQADTAVNIRSVDFERSKSVELTFAPRATTVLTFKLKKPGTPYRSRPDLGIGRRDVVVNGSSVLVTVHSLGAVDAPATTVAVKDATGRVIATGDIPTLAAPVDLTPKTAVVKIPLPVGSKAAGGSVELDPDHKLEEITRVNNAVQW